MFTTWHGRFYQAQKALAEQATEALFSFNNLFERIDISISETIMLFDSMITTVPILNYASENPCIRYSMSSSLIP